MQTLVRYGSILLTLAASCGPAQAWTGEITWPTYDRAGPGRTYAVLDELDRGETVEVLSCNQGWCQVQIGRSAGYAEQEWIVQASAGTQPFHKPGPEGCVESRVTGSGYKGGLDYQFCPQQGRVGVPSGQPSPGSTAPLNAFP